MKGFSLERLKYWLQEAPKPYLGYWLLVAFFIGGSLLFLFRSEVISLFNPEENETSRFEDHIPAGQQALDRKMEALIRVAGDGVVNPDWSQPEKITAYNEVLISLLQGYVTSDITVWGASSPSLGKEERYSEISRLRKERDSALSFYLFVEAYKGYLVYLTEHPDLQKQVTDVVKLWSAYLQAQDLFMQALGVYNTETWKADEKEWQDALVSFTKGIALFTPTSQD